MAGAFTSMDATALFGRTFLRLGRQRRTRRSLVGWSGRERCIKGRCARFLSLCLGFVVRSSAAPTPRQAQLKALTVAAGPPWRPPVLLPRKAVRRTWRGRRVRAAHRRRQRARARTRVRVAWAAQVRARAAALGRLVAAVVVRARRATLAAVLSPSQPIRCPSAWLTMRVTAGSRAAAR